MSTSVNIRNLHVTATMTFGNLGQSKSASIATHRPTLSVNRPVEPATFTPDGLGVPGGTPLVDYRAAVPKRLGKIQKSPPK
jgi:hypothetical protein